MNWKSNVVLGLCLTAFLSLGASAENLVQNGSFESPGSGNLVPNPGGGISATYITGWAVHTGDIDYVPSTSWTASDGSMSLDLLGFNYGGIRQTIATEPGKTYLVTFDLAANPGGSPIKELRVSAAGADATFEFDSAGRTGSDMGWKTKSWTFVAASTSTVLSFECLSGDSGFNVWAGPAIDNVQAYLFDGPNLLLNGSFEDGDYTGSPGGGWWQWVDDTPGVITGWTVTVGNERLNWTNSALGGWGSADGYKNVELDQLSTISQSFATVVGETYTVAFSMSGNYYSGPAVKTVEVSVGNFSQEFTYENDGSPWQEVAYETRAFCFEATGPTSTITFAGQDESWWAAVIDDVIVKGPQTISVLVDIKPGSDENPINLKSKGVIPVAILTTDDFDASTVDGSTVVFAGAGPAHGEGHLEDVDGDGDVDWIGHFRTQETSIGPEDTGASLVGQTTDGQDLEGSDVVSIPKGSNKGKAKKPALGGELTFGVENFPNPFNPTTTIRYSLPEVSEVRLAIYNVLGQQVRVLVDAVEDAGIYSVKWDGRDAFGHEVTTGMYLYRLEAGSNLAVRKMMLVK